VKVIRATKCNLKFTTETKRQKLKEVLVEYSTVVNFFINYFWDNPPKKAELLKSIVNLPTTWLSARLRKVAAREALDLISSAKEVAKTRSEEQDKIVLPIKPIHHGKSMSVSSTIAALQIPKEATEYDAWLHMTSIGNGVILDLPIRFHKHYNNLRERGRRLESYIIHENYVQFCFEIETGTKTTEGNVIGVDTGINALASTSDGKQFGTDIKALVENIKRKTHGSNKQKSARRALKQRMNEVAKETIQGTKLVVVEKLSNLNHKTKLTRRVSKNIRRSLGAWAYRYWLSRLQWTAEDNRVSFRTVSPAYTSQRCHACGHTERGNRSGTKFLCLRCDHADDADLNAAKNIRDRFLSGLYGAAYKPEKLCLSTRFS
jgi:IS605 OrfB family transposase